MSSDNVSVLVLVIPLAGVVGLFVGSFLNVVIYRTPRGLSVTSPRSFCPTCVRQLQWWENVPLMSWLGLRGRCRTCHEAISIRYPLVEMATGVTFALITWAWHGSFLAAAYCVLAASMIAVALIEYGGQRTPLSVPAVGTGLAGAIIIASAAYQHRWPVAVGALIGFVVALGAYVGLRTSDPADVDPRGHGRSALIVVGCWVGSLGPLGATAGVTSWILAYAICVACTRAATGQSVATDGATIRTVPPSRLDVPVMQTPLVTAIAVAMLVSLLVGT